MYRKIKSIHVIIDPNEPIGTVKEVIDSGDNQQATIELSENFKRAVDILMGI